MVFLFLFLFLFISLDFCTLLRFLTFVYDFHRFGFGELSPVCAVVGGVMAQEVIKVLRNNSLFGIFTSLLIEPLSLDHRFEGRIS